MLTIQNTILAATATTTALMAGLFFAYSCSVTLGLQKLPDAEYIAAMQSINRAIQNPVFFLVFFGTLLLLPVSAYLNYHKPVSLKCWLLIAAMFIYFIGVFGVTAAGNIPLNNSLDKFNLANSSKEIIALKRAAFETRWNNLNIIRTLSSLLTVILIIVACITNDRSN